MQNSDWITPGQAKAGHTCMAHTQTRRLGWAVTAWQRRAVRAWQQALLLFSLCLCMATMAWAMEDNRPIAIIVSAQTALAPDIHADELSLIFWRKKLYAMHGQPLRPVNLFSEHPLRLRFSQQILRSSPKSQVNYWNGLYFHGVQPPFTVQSEEAMIRYVAETDGAVGYIDACRLDERVKPVFWLTAGKLASEPPSLHCELN